MSTDWSRYLLANKKAAVMHSYPESRENRECYGFMNSESHNGIFHADDSVRYEGTDTTRDALDLRLGKADESSNYFAGTNLLSDGLVESPLDAIPSRPQEPKQSNIVAERNVAEGVAREIDNLNAPLPTSNPPHHEFLYQDRAQKIKNDIRTRRSRVVSEGAISLAHNASSDLHIDRSERQRSISMPYPLDNRRRGGANFAPRSEFDDYKDSDNLISRSHSNADLDTSIQMHRNAPSEKSSHSSLRKSNGNPRLNVTNRLDYRVARPFTKRSEIEVDTSNNVRSNASSQQDLSFPPTPLGSQVPLNQRRGFKGAYEDIDNILRLGSNPNLSDTVSDRFTYLPKKVNPQTPSTSSSKQAGEHTNNGKKHSNPEYNLHLSNVRLSPVPEDTLPLKYEFDSELTESARCRRVETATHLLELAGEREKEERYSRELSQEALGLKDELHCRKQGSTTHFPAAFQAYTTPLSVHISEPQTSRDSTRKHDQSTIRRNNTELTLDGRGRNLHRETSISSSASVSSSNRLHSNHSPPLLQEVPGLSESEKLMPHQITLHLRRNEHCDDTCGRIGQIGERSDGSDVHRMSEHSYAGAPDYRSSDVREGLNPHNPYPTPEINISQHQMEDRMRVKSGGQDSSSGQTVFLVNNSAGSQNLIFPQVNTLNMPNIKQEVDVALSPVDFDGNERLREIASHIKKEEQYARMLRPPTSPTHRQRSSDLQDARYTSYNIAPSGPGRSLPQASSSTDTLMHIKRNNVLRLSNSSDPNETLHYSNTSLLPQQHILSYTDQEGHRRTNHSGRHISASSLPSTNSVQYSPTMQNNKDHTDDPSFGLREDSVGSLAVKRAYLDNMPCGDLPDILGSTKAGESAFRSVSPPVPALIKNKTCSSLFLDRVLQQQAHPSDNMSHSRSKSPSSGSRFHRASPNMQEDHGGGEDIDDRLKVATMQSLRNRKRSFQGEDEEKNVSQNTTSDFHGFSKRNREENHLRNFSITDTKGPGLLPLPQLEMNVNRTPQKQRLFSGQHNYISPNDRSSEVVDRTSPSYMQSRHDNIRESLLPYSLKQFKANSNLIDSINHSLDVRIRNAEQRSAMPQITSTSPTGSRSPVDDKSNIPLIMESPEDFKRRILRHCQQEDERVAASSMSSLPVNNSFLGSRLSPNARQSLERRRSQEPSPTPKGYPSIISPTPHGEEGNGTLDIQDQRGPGSVGSGHSDSGIGDISSVGKGKRGRPRKHAPKIPLPPLYVFIRNMLMNRSYNPKTISWVNEGSRIFKVNNTSEFARTWGLMKSNRSEEMNYEKMSRAMRYHYGSEKTGRKGHLAMVKEKRLVYRFGELAVNCRSSEVCITDCSMHDLCKDGLCLWTKE